MASPIGRLDQLTLPQREQLLSWLDYLEIAEVVAKVAAPPPAGFGLQTYPTSLRRFRQRHQAAEMKATLGLARAFDAEPGSADTCERGAMNALLQQAVELAASSDPARVTAAARLLGAYQRHQHRQRALALQERRLELECRKVAAFLAIREAGLDTKLAEAEVKAAIEFIRPHSERIAATHSESLPTPPA